MNIVKHIPNTITSMNLLSGVIGVIFALDGRLDIAFPLMLAAAVFDFCDGLSARLLGAYSEIGKELDSLADVVSFGVLPSIMLFKTMVLHNGPSFWCLLPLLLAAFSALRLAKFNLDTRQTTSFIGLPTPSAAMICGSYAYYVQVTEEMTWLTRLAENNWFIPVLAIGLSLLLISEIPMFGMKFGKGHKADALENIQRIGFLSLIALITIIVVVTRNNWSLIVFSSFIMYIIMNILFAFRFMRKSSEK